MHYIGIDIAGLKRKQVIAILNNDFHTTILAEYIKDKDDIQKLAERICTDYGKDSVIAIDAPRCWANGSGYGRKCEKDIKKELKVNPLWAPSKNECQKQQFEWMRIGIWFYDVFSDKFKDIIEVFPSASYVVLNKSDVSFKMNICEVDRKSRKDVLDAICAAITGYYYKNIGYTAYGDEKDGYIIVPKDKAEERLK